MVFGDILDDEGKALADELPDRAIYLHLDVTKEDDWMEAIAVTDGLGGIDILVVDATYTTGSELVVDGGALLGLVLTIQ